MLPFIIFFSLTIFGSLLLILMKLQSRSRLRATNLADIDSMSGVDFEHYISQLLISRGFTTKTTKRSNDFGADIIAQQNQNRYSIQLKRYSHPVDRSAISDAVAAMTYYGCNKSMVITTNYFTKSAQVFAKLHHCQLIDRTELTSWIITFQKKSH